MMTDAQKETLARKLNSLVDYGQYGGNYGEFEKHIKEKTLEGVWPNIITFSRAWAAWKDGGDYRFWELLRDNYPTAANKHASEREKQAQRNPVRTLHLYDVGGEMKIGAHEGMEREMSQRYLNSMVDANPDRGDYDLFEKRILRGDKEKNDIPNSTTITYAIVAVEEGDPRFWNLLLKMYPEECAPFLDYARGARDRARDQEIEQWEENGRHVRGNISDKLAITGDARTLIEQL
jgi:hypothetical protein